MELSSSSDTAGAASGSCVLKRLQLPAIAASAPSTRSFPVELHAASRNSRTRPKSRRPRARAPPCARGSFHVIEDERVPSFLGSPRFQGHGRASMRRAVARSWRPCRREVLMPRPRRSADLGSLVLAQHGVDPGQAAHVGHNDDQGIGGERAVRVAALLQLREQAREQWEEAAVELRLALGVLVVRVPAQVRCGRRGSRRCSSGRSGRATAPAGSWPRHRRDPCPWEPTAPARSGGRAAAAPSMRRPAPCSRRRRGPRGHRPAPSAAGPGAAAREPPARSPRAPSHRCRAPARRTSRGCSHCS